MKKTIITLTLLLGGISFILLNSCKSNKCGQTKYSQANESESHNMGKNCLSCHVSGGKGDGCFEVGGTVYGSDKKTTVSGGTLKLYTGPNGTGSLVTTLAIDKLGNVYTTNSVDFSSGLYPVVISSGGQTQYMGSKTTTGACNSCHGVSQDVVWVP